MIWVYYHAQQEPPHWEIPEFPEYTSEEWTPFRFIHKWKIRTHPQELGENGMDFAHSLVVHPQQTRHIENRNLKIEDSFLTLSLAHTYNVFWVARILGQEIQGPHEIGLYGLGCAINRVLVKPMGFEYFVMFTMTPIDGEYIEFTGFSMMKKVINGIVTKFLLDKQLKEAKITINQDIPIWENKAYLSHPLLCDGDGPIAQYRRWASQFYSGHLKNSDFTTEKPKSKNSTAGIEENKDSLSTGQKA